MKGARRAAIRRLRAEADDLDALVERRERAGTPAGAAEAAAEAQSRRRAARILERSALLVDESGAAPEDATPVHQPAAATTAEANLERFTGE